jgi:hypothetical protein
MVEAVLGKAAGIAEWKIDAIGDDSHGKQLWQNSVESSRKEERFRQFRLETILRR